MGLARISTPIDDSFIIYSDFRSALQALGNYIPGTLWTSKYSASWPDFTPAAKTFLSAVSCPMWDCLVMKGRIAWPNGPVFFRHQIPYPCFFKTSILRVARAVRESWQACWDTSRAARNKLALIKPTVDGDLEMLDCLPAHSAPHFPTS